MGRRPFPRGQQPPGQNPEDTEEHAREVRAVLMGQDIVEGLAGGAEGLETRPPAFEQRRMMMVRAWFGRRPLEPPMATAALVAFPRMWTTKRGRYCRFRAPGAGVYGILRARPTF